MAIKRNPYPILENENGDFQNFSFGANVLKAEINDGVFSFHFKSELTEPVLQKYIDKGLISFGIKVESKPFYSKTILAKDVNDAVQFDINYKTVPANFSFKFIPILIAISDFTYKNTNADEPLNEYEFKINKNQILARSSIELSFEIGYKEQKSGAIIKILKLSDNNRPFNGTYDIKLDDSNNILVYLAEEDFVKVMKLNNGHQKMLDALITVPVLQYALSDYIKNPNDYEENNREWFDILDAEYDIVGEVKEMQDVLKKCNQILNNPLIPFVDYFQKKYVED
jgi:hypothetical protein